jgi:cytochrome c peroxidase
MKRRYTWLVFFGSVLFFVPAIAQFAAQHAKQESTSTFLGTAENNSQQLVEQGRQVFRFDTFGDESFWGDTLQLHKAIEGANLGGVGPGVSPATALALGLKVDLDALPANLVQALKLGKVNLNDPATTLALLKLNAVVGLTGFFNSQGTLRSMGIQCALCHSTVDNSFAFGIGQRIDGLGNRDLNVGAIVAAAPNLQPVADLLSLAGSTVTVAQVRSVLNSWGPGKFDAELFLDGKATNPQQVTHDVVTATNVPGATLIPNARGLAGHNLHTWTGGWGTVTYWNAFVAVNEMHGVGTFFDERFDNAMQFPVAAAAHLGHVSVSPDSDQVTSKLPALHFFQLALPAVQPRPNIDFDPAAAARGDELFSGKANCNSCHHEPLWSEPGWNQHTADEMKIDSFEADRAPGHAYRTMNLAGIFVRERGLFMDPANKGRFYHDGRFPTLLDVVNSYNDRFGLGLTDSEKHDLVEYLKSL